MSEAKTLKDLKNGDLINVDHGGQTFKAKFIRFNSEETSMQVFARGKLTFYPVATFAGMLDTQKSVGDILEEAKAKKDEKVEKEKSKIEKQPKQDLEKGAEKKEMKTKEKKSAVAKEKKLAKAPKVEKEKKAAKEPKEAKAPKVDRSTLVKLIKKGDQTPKQIMKEAGASKTDMIAAMLLNNIDAETIKKDLGLSITQFVYNVRASLYKSGELTKD